MKGKPRHPRWQGEENVWKKIDCGLVGDKTLVLNVPKRDEMPDMAEWINDHEVSKWLCRLSGLTIEQEYAWLEKTSEAPTAYTWGIYLDGKLIGSCNLHYLDHLAQSAYYGVVIGAKEHWGKGIGTQILRKVSEFGFQNLNLKTIYLDALTGNGGSQKSAEKAGYKYYGTKPNFRLVDGVWHGLWQSALDRDEWLATSK